VGVLLLLGIVMGALGASLAGQVGDLVHPREALVLIAWAAMGAFLLYVAAALARSKAWARGAALGAFVVLGAAAAWWSIDYSINVTEGDGTGFVVLGA